MKLISGIQNMPKGFQFIQNKVQEWKSAELTPEDKKTINSAVYRASKRLSDRQIRGVTEEKIKLNQYIKYAIDPVHASRMNHILDPKKHHKLTQILKKSAVSKLNKKERMRINILCDSRNFGTI